MIVPTSTTPISIGPACHKLRSSGKLDPVRCKHYNDISIAALARQIGATVITTSAEGFSIIQNVYVAVVEFKSPLRARVVLTYGNSSQPDSPHNGDQLKLFSEKKMRPAWLQRSEIEDNLEQQEDLSPYARSSSMN